MKCHLTKYHQDLYDCWCNTMPWNHYFIQILVFRVLARKGMNYAFCMNWERKCSSGSGHTVSFSMASGRAGDKAFEKFTIFSLKLVYFLFKSNKAGVSVKFLMVGETNSIVGYHLMTEDHLIQLGVWWVLWAPQQIQGSALVGVRIFWKFFWI